ncbi:MAG: DUF192 domain-containing protein [Methanobacterium sp.]|jgi:uncharacterized membrane protein (UPF0127 family)
MPQNSKKGSILVINKSKESTLGPVEMADSFSSRFRGLMLKKSLKKGMILKIPKGRGKMGSAIHMFFMRIPLDVIFLNNEKTVLDQVTLKPWQTYTPKKAARYVVELKQGNLISSETEIGDILDFIYE